MSIPKGPALDLIEATETTIAVEFKPLSNVSEYELQWKEIERTWNEVSSKSVKPSSSSSGKKKCKAEAYDLQPGMTYCIRLVCIGGGSSSKGEPGPELIIDTEQVGCAPKSSGCVIL